MLGAWVEGLMASAVAISDVEVATGTILAAELLNNGVMYEELAIMELVAMELSGAYVGPMSGMYSVLEK